MGNVQSESVSYLPDNSFRVIIDGGDDAGTFSKAGPLFKWKADAIEIRTGTSFTKEADEPGNVTFEDLVLEQGMSTNQRLAQMADEVINNGGQSGNNSPSYKHIVRVEQLDRDKTTVLMSYTYEKAWVISYDEGSFDADSNKFRIRSCTIRFIGKPIKKIGAQ